MDIPEAIEKDSMLDDSHRELHSGDADGEFEKCDHVIEGEVASGGQDHFYLEPHTSTAWCGEEKEVIVMSACQNPGGNQYVISLVLGTILHYFFHFNLSFISYHQTPGIPMNKVEVKAKRVGGGFGGKHFNGLDRLPYHLTAYLLLRQRNEIDPHLQCCSFGSLQVEANGESGARTRRKHGDDGWWQTSFLHQIQNRIHKGNGAIFYITWTILRSPQEGKIIAARFRAWNNGGYVQDLSVPVLEAFLMSLDNAYYMPNFSAVGSCCKVP